MNRGILFLLGICISIMPFAKVLKAVSYSAADLKSVNVCAGQNKIYSISEVLFPSFISNSEIIQNTELINPPENFTGTIQAIENNGFKYRVSFSWTAPVSEIQPIWYKVYIDGDLESQYITTETSCSFEITPTGDNSVWFYVTAEYEMGESAPTEKVNLIKDIPTVIIDGETLNPYIDGTNIGSGAFDMESHWYKFYVPQIQSGDNKLRLLASGTSDLSMYLYKGNMSTLTDMDENINPYNDAQLEIENSEGEWFYIKIKAQSPGTYFLNINNIPLYYKNLVLNKAFYASFNSIMETVEYRFTTDRAGSYSIQTKGNLNTVLSLFDSNGLIEQKDDGGDDNNALIERNLAANTEYIIRMSASSTGDYSIIVNVSELIVNAQCITSSVYFSTFDWYKFRTGNAGIYIIEQALASFLYISLYESDQSTHIETTIIDPYNPHQNYIERTLNANTTYYIKIYNNETLPPTAIQNANNPYCINVKTKSSIYISPLNISLDYKTGAYGTTVIQSNTTWSIADDADWLSVSPATGTNDGTLTIAANSANTGVVPRTATITITGEGVADKQVTVVQGIAPVKQLGNSEVYVYTNTDANLRAMPVTFSENGTINSISIYHNGGNGSVILGVYTDQGGKPATRLGSTTSASVNSTAGWQTVSLSNPVSVTSGQTVWLTWIFENNPGVRYAAGTPGRASSANTWISGMPATFGTSNIAGFRYSIYCNYTTAGVLPNLTVSPLNISLDYKTGAYGITVIQSNTTWSVSDDADWLSVSPATGTNDGTLTITANSANTGVVPRTATITITGEGVADKQVTVVQGIAPVKQLGNSEVYVYTNTDANLRAMPVTFSENGTINSISIYHNGGNGSVILGVYTDQGGKPATRLGSTTSVSVNPTAGWQTVTLSNPVSVTSGQTVWLTWIFENNPGVRYAAGTPGRASSANTWISGMPATFGTSNIAGFRYSIYCNYTTAGELPLIENITKSAEVVSPVRESSRNETCNLKVYPNPFSEVLHFEFVSPKSVNARIDLYDLSGRLINTIFEQPIENDIYYNAEFKSETLVNGIYFYRLMIGEIVFNGRVILKK